MAHEQQSRVHTGACNHSQSQDTQRAVTLVILWDFPQENCTGCTLQELVEFGTHKSENGLSQRVY